MQISFKLIQNATSRHSQSIVNRSLTYHLMAATQVGSRPQISTDRPPSAHLSLFDTNCTLSGSGRPAAFSLLCTKSALTVGHQRSEEASYLTRHTRVRLDVIKGKNVIFKHCFYFIFLLLLCPPAIHPEPPRVLPNFRAAPHATTLVQPTVVGALSTSRLLRSFPFKIKDPELLWTSV